MDQSLDTILELLKLERLEVNLFRGQSPNEQRQRVFGGQVLGQALMAACYTVEDMFCHSFHSYFLRRLVDRINCHPRQTQDHR